MRTADTPLSVRARHWLLAALAVVVLPHTARLPWWISAFALAVALTYWTLARRPKRRLPGAMIALVTLAGTAGVALQYGTLLGRNPGIALLVVMAALKLLEVRRQRDVLLVVFLCYFLVITNFLFSQTPLMAAYMFAATVLITATLSVATHEAATRTAYDHLRLAGVLLAQALPVMLVLFIFFPRVAGPIWGLPKDAYSAMSGLGDSMSPGAFNRLVQSDAPAFRVVFKDPAPAPTARYWRGPVFWHTDGRTWTVGPYAGDAARAPLPTRAAPVRYAVTLEPHNQRWLFTLDLAAQVSVTASSTVDYQWLAPKPVRERMQYEATSYTRFNTGALRRGERNAALQLPDAMSARVAALARDWRSGAASDRAIVRRALEHFRNEPFVYTLSPPRLGDDPVDEFLFSTRRGFCEHYTAAFVVLMRSAGVPARVVTGYQGGSYNPLGEYWIVRQSDAHAWAEVWLDGAGWTRVDPTAAVAPERVEHALDTGALASDAPARFRLTDDSLLARGLRAARNALDAVDHNWNLWVLSYGPQRQLELLGAMGFRQPSWREMAVALAVLTSALVIAIAAWMLLRAPRATDPVLRLYETFCAQLARIGLQRASNEGPQDFARRVRTARPDLAPQADEITQLYVRLRYGKQVPVARHVARLRKLVRRFGIARFAPPSRQAPATRID